MTHLTRRQRYLLRTYIIPALLAPFAVVLFWAWLSFLFSF